MRNAVCDRVDLLGAWWGWTWECFDLERKDAFHVLRALVFSSGNGGGENFDRSLFFGQSFGERSGH